MEFIEFVREGGRSKIDFWPQRPFRFGEHSEAKWVKNVSIHPWYLQASQCNIGVFLLFFNVNSTLSHVHLLSEGNVLGEGDGRVVVLLVVVHPHL